MFPTFQKGRVHINRVEEIVLLRLPQTNYPLRKDLCMSTSMRAAVLFNLTLWLCLFMVHHASARAGGGGGGSDAVVGGGIFAVVIAVIVLPVWIAWMLIKKAKTKTTDILHTHQLHQAAKLDPIWDEDAVKVRVEKVFFTVQRAWMARDQQIARDFVTERLYDKHKLQTDIMLETHEKNMLQNLNLLEVQVVRVDDSANNARDKLWTRIRASMIDFMINEKDGHVTGSTSQVKEFIEVWKFVRGPGGWLLDEIDQNVSQV